MRHLPFRTASTTAVAIAVAAIGLATVRAASPAAPSFTVTQAVSFPFPENLTASPAGSTIAWTFSERGLRNIYVAEGPAFTPRRLTNYTMDDHKS